MYASPPPVRTTVVAVSPRHAHRPFGDGRAWVGDRLQTTIRDPDLPGSLVMTVRVCFTVPAAHVVDCRRIQFGRTVLQTVTFAVRSAAAATIRWYQATHLLATRKLRVTGP
jgi:hypothetical protein